MNTSVTGRPTEILLVDDNPGDVRLTMEALKDSGAQSRLHAVSDGESAIAFLRREGRYRDAPRADLVLLDLNMPGMHGLQVLAEIRQDPALKGIPVAVLTGSHSTDDIARTYDLDANCYIIKPIDFEQFIIMVKSVTAFWAASVRAPLEDT